MDLRLVQRFPGAVSADDEFSHAVEYAKTQVRNCYDGEASPRDGRLAQLVRAPALQAGSRGFESLTAHQVRYPRAFSSDNVRPGVPFTTDTGTNASTQTGSAR